MATSENFIKQINLGGGENGTVYDIAVAHGLTFVTGQNSQIWDGVSDVTVNIPTLAELISDPIRFAGTVGANGTPVDHNGNSLTASRGDLIFVTADCSLVPAQGQDAIACEAGDMAVYDGTKWIVVSGENQVEIKAGTTPTSVSGNLTSVTLTTTAKTVLDVEGKELALTIPDLSVTKNADNVITLADVVASPDVKWIKLTYSSAAEDTAIGQNKSIALPSALADGTVTFSGDTAVLKATDITSVWTSGSNGSHASEAVTFAISGNVDLAVAAGNDFVTGWTPSTSDFVQSALKSANLKLVTAANKSDDEQVAVNPYVISNPTFSNDATLFATSISAVSTGADFTIPGAVSVSDESSKPASNGLVVDVTLPTLGDAASFTDVNYESADASTGVIATIADPTVTITGSNVIANASVSGSVLIITPGTVSATASQGAVTYKKAQYKKTVVSNNPGVSYGSIQTADGQGYKLNTQAVQATFTAGAVGYMGFESAEVSAADKASAYIGLTASTGQYTAALANGASGTIPSNTVITAVSDAVVPVLGDISATGAFTGSVATALSTSNVTVAELSVSAINLGTYALEASTANNGGIIVADGADATVSGSITIVSGTYVTNVTYVS